MKKKLLDLLVTGYWEPNLCPKCGGDVTVTNTLSWQQTPGLRRRRVCLNPECKCVFYTREVLEEPVDG